MRSSLHLEVFSCVVFTKTIVGLGHRFDSTGGLCRMRIGVKMVSGALSVRMWETGPVETWVLLFVFFPYVVSFWTVG